MGLKEQRRRTFPVLMGSLTARLYSKPNADVMEPITHTRTDYILTECEVCTEQYLPWDFRTDRATNERGLF